MRRLVLLAILLILLLTLGTTLTVQNAQQSAGLPDSLAALHFDTCALPCWNGIIPGKTTIDEARQQLEDTFANSPTYRYLTIDNTFVRLGGLLVDPADKRNLAVAVQITDDSIALNFSSIWGKIPTLGEIHRWLGPPLRVQRPQLTTSGEYNYIWLYDRVGYRVAVFATSTFRRVQLNEPVNTIQISLQNRVPTGADINPLIVMSGPWRGFRSVFVYLHPDS